MAISPQHMTTWCRKVLGFASDAPHQELEQYVEAAPGLDTLDDVPSGTAVLVRGDVDAKPGAKIGEGDIRLRSMVDTLQHGQQKGWKQVIFGHIGRKPEGSLNKVAARLGELLGCDVPLISDWLDDASGKILDSAANAIAQAAPGSVIMLENTRKYDLERVLWKAKNGDLAGLSERLSTYANELAEKVGGVYIHEALSAGSMDASSVVAPAAMQRVALGKYIAAEFRGPMLRCREAQLVVFSGLKIDKLDDLEAIVRRGKVRVVIAAGSLAMALLKAQAQLDGKQFCLGVAEDEAHADKPYYIPPSRVEQASQLIAMGRSQGTDFVLPADFVLADGNVAETLKPGDQQFDVGPASSERFAAAVGQFLESSPGGVAFHNGVFGMFEDARFESGTKKFVEQLKRMKDAGAEVYVGGGEGGAALEKYGQEDWVTHVFTAGGTVLNALGSEPVPYLQALYVKTRG